MCFVCLTFFLFHCVYYRRRYFFVDVWSWNFSSCTHASHFLRLRLTSKNGYLSFVSDFKVNAPNEFMIKEKKKPDRIELFTYASVKTIDVPFRKLICCWCHHTNFIANFKLYFRIIVFVLKDWKKKLSTSSFETVYLCPSKSVGCAEVIFFILFTCYFPIFECWQLRRNWKQKSKCFKNEAYGIARCTYFD